MCFSNGAAFDKSLTVYLPLLQAGHFSSVLSHFATCFRCHHMVALITDGKYGARRRVCANVEKFLSWPMLKIALQTGCDNTASSKVLYCKSCREQLSRLEQDQLGADLSSQIAVLGLQKCSTGDGPCLLHKVVQKDGSVIEVARSKVAARLLSTFEAVFASRRRQKQAPPKTRIVQVRMRVRKRLSGKG